MKPTLLILAAGMGSRYGSLKQMDGLGPNGETIMDYSVYDAIRAGFGKVVFVIRENFEKDFREVFSKERYGNKIEVDYVLQELDKIPSQFALNPERTKPWGTNHAVMMAKEVINEPFAVINADDFYGKNAFAVLGKYLSELNGSSNQYCMVGYYLGNTLSEMGAVSRGVCSADTEGNLTSVVERTHIEKLDGVISYKDEAGNLVALGDKTIVSMNMWGFTPDYFEHSDAMFSDFLANNMENIKSEFFIPLVVNNLISTGTAKLRVLDTDAQWFGVTYQGDRPAVIEKLNSLIAKGEYPNNLWA
ncbi:sugar phosphate nucleotidyltransferase [Alistipes sp. ZOR0009]|uniref:sugar phosphate nucleotidyltransferase n=1 Tax=Alistipes sp. ZOR0009 TaxID=1339253 RepID=UPI000645CA83|nr:sugar phosphate nucleotidyltransferase [Alistipes sp. ZOR0009]